MVAKAEAAAAAAAAAEDSHAMPGGAIRHLKPPRGSKRISAGSSDDSFAAGPSNQDNYHNAANLQQAGRRRPLQDISNRPPAHPSARIAPSKAKDSSTAAATVHGVEEAAAVTRSDAAFGHMAGVAAAISVRPDALVHRRSSGAQAMSLSSTRMSLAHEEMEDMEDDDAPASNPLHKDIDEDCKDDPLQCTSYVNEIYDHLREAEQKRRPAMNYMENMQSDINAAMRGILVDWLVEVSEEYKLNPETLHAATNYIDRMLSRERVDRSQLQLVGVACMLIAAKYEEIWPPAVDHFVYITDNTYTREQLLGMERRVLRTLNYELTCPTAKPFLQRFLKAAGATNDERRSHLADFLTELCLVEYSMLQFLPSTIAASAVFLANIITGHAPWTYTLQHYAQYTPVDLQECVKAMHQLYLRYDISTLPAVREKYSQPKVLTILKRHKLHPTAYAGG
eukprot:jgi/Chlat1/3467/Chrsp23S03672